ncbi:TetR/AcrR family transcriptional regulator [Saccharibacillus sp. JS10]|uniref:TetR/AcrR family transcriptional regulator n=1 Tax=Saccharibacillus sp. JS10 TaxID=2950552 RepID=UPI002108FC7A|nr:TetR/AcrR family transcriptional regulator [Saccharibacillus sp. JS10]MCQ4085454.1 TetR/AcrR family transcriptional regulator [Saccharibacillus sp. JS10]
MTENEVVRTSIAESLLQLMQKQTLDKITIVELTKRAGVSRMSFYRNFNSKEEVLVNYMEQIFQDFVNQIPDFNELKVFEDSKVFFSYLRHHHVLMRSLMKADLFSIFTNSFSHHFVKLFVDVYQLDRNEQYRSYELSYRIGGLANIILVWVKNDFQESDEQMADVFRYLYEM